jgi:DNA-binding CsgD family transcriptional regulator/tetratricopeptide (TPR) repeat protein
MSAARLFVGRAAELERIGAALEQARHSRSGGLFVLGEPGVGKSRLIIEAEQMALNCGIRVARAGCLPFMAPLPLDPVLGLLRSLGRPVGGSIRASSRELFALVVEHVEQVTLQGPVLLCLDDLQWSDAATIDLVQHCLERLRDLPIAWLLAARNGRSQERIARRLEHGRVLEQIELSPLTDAETQLLAEAALGRAYVGAELLSVLYERTGGNAFLYLELLRAVSATGVEARESAIGAPAAAEAIVPASVSDSIDERAERLAAVARMALSWAAILPEPFSHGELRSVAGPEPAGALGELADGDFLLAGADGHWSFVHSLIRDAVYAGLPQAERVRRHGLVADVLLDGPPERLAPQLEHARRFTAAADVYTRLGESALAIGQGEDATRLFERAEELAGTARDQPLARQARVGLVLALLDSGAGGRAHQLARTLRRDMRTHASAEEQLRFLSRYATATINVRDEADVETARDALAEAEPLLASADCAIVSETLATRAWISLRLNEVARALADADAAAALLPDNPPPDLEARVLNAAGLAIGIGRSATEGIEVLTRATDRALQAGLPLEAARAHTNLAYLYELTGDLEAVRTHVRLGLAIPGAPAAMTAALHANLSYNEAQLGRLDTALGHALTGLRIASSLGLGMEARIARALGFIHLWRGELAASRRVLETSKIIAGDPRDPAATALWGELLEAEGSIAQALEHYRQGLSFEDATSLDCELGLARTAVALGDVALARTALARIVELTRRWPQGEWMYEETQAWVASAEGRIDDAVTHFRTAAEHTSRAYDAVRLRLEAGRLAGDRDDVKAAIDAFEQMGAARAADRGRGIARSLGMRVGQRRGPAGALSPREQEVAHLVAAGRTNAEIAYSLFLSQRTVERHVSSILVKLDYRSRVQIATDAAAGRLPGARVAVGQNQIVAADPTTGGSC